MTLKNVLFPVGRQFISDKPFPESLGPLGLQAAEGFTAADIELDVKQLTWKMKADTALAGFLSEVSPITLSAFERAELGIVASCTKFAYCYQSPNIYLKFSNKYDDLSAEEFFLKNGGFVYFDDAGSVGVILAVTDFADGLSDLSLGEPVDLKPDMVKKLKMAQRYRPVTVPFLVEAGSIEFAWVLPGELPWAPDGGFAYIIDENPPVLCNLWNFFGYCSASGSNDPAEPEVSSFPEQTLLLDENSSTLVRNTVQKERNSANLYRSSVQDESEFNLSEAVAKTSEQLPSGPRICILGGRQFQEESSRLLVQALAKNFANELKGKVVIITGGLEGIQAEFAQNFGIAEQIVNMVPEEESSHVSIGTELKAGAHLQERIAIYGEIGDVYLTVEGGPGVSKEAKAASDRGAVVLPIMWTGGASGGMFDFPQKALNQPDYFSAGEWKQLKEKGDSAPENLAQSTAKLVVSAIAKLIDDGKVGQR